MAQRRMRRRFAPPSRTRALNWQSNAENAFVPSAAAAIRTVVLLSSALGIGTDEASFTCYRIVGTIQVQTQADVNTQIHLGVYYSPGGPGGITQILNPFIDADQEDWMWWTALATGTNANNRFPVHQQFINVDIKVKRIIRGGDDIKLGIVSVQALNSLVNLRILSKRTGIR